MCKKIETVFTYDKPNESNSDVFAGDTLHIHCNNSTFHKIQNVLHKLIPKNLNSNLIMPL